MGTEVHYKNLFPGYHSMRNVNEDPNSSNWHLFNMLTNSHYYDGFTPRTITDAYPDHDKDDLKHKMLQHEAVFKNQVHELHRLYRRQRDIMEEVKRKEFNKYPISIDTSSSSSHMPAQKPYEDANRWQNPSFPLGNTTSRPSIFGVDISDSPLSSKDCEIVECRPSKVRKRLFDLQLPGHVYVDPEEGEHIVDNQTSEISSYPVKENGFGTKNGVKTFLDDGGKKDGYTNVASGQHFMRSNTLADLNEPVYGLDVDFLSPSSKPERFSNLRFEGKSNGRDMSSSCLREPGNNGGNMNYTSQYFETSKLQTPSVTMQQHRGIYSKSQDHSHFNPNPLLLNTSSAYPFASTSDKANSLSSSWIKSADSLTHKLTSLQKHTSFLSSPKNHEVFRDKWHRNGNGFYNGSSSGSKELPARLHSVGFGYQNCNKLDDGSRKIFKGSNFIDLTGTTKDMDLNTVQNSSNEDDNSRKHDLTVLPWLRAKPVICENVDRVGDVKEKDNYSDSNKKLLGFPIFGNFCVPKNDESSAVSTSASIEHRGIDINVTWDDGTEKQVDVKTDEAEIKNFKNHFDLNSCVTEDDDLFVTESVKSSKKATMEIDLEAPAVSETAEDDERNETELEPDHLKSTELEKTAAEVIIAISSQKEHAGAMSKAANDNDDDNDNDNNDDRLSWFVEVINSCEKNLVFATHETDEYEMLTLRLEETKEEDYMPMPIVPDFEEPDEAGPASTSSRPRRGHTRRGRPRRDFQRDVLPGMTSLSRHEITEDLQIFGGLMRATGHSWNIGSTRRNGKRLGAWGRRKVKELETTPAATTPPPPPPPLSSKQVNNIEAVGLDERSLAGWGKTTRRPRRQRCAAGNSVAVQLT